jgi:hypothetical protein
VTPKATGSVAMASSANSFKRGDRVKTSSLKWPTQHASSKTSLQAQNIATQC